MTPKHKAFTINDLPNALEIQLAIAELEAGALILDNLLGRHHRAAIVLHSKAKIEQITLNRIISSKET